MRQPPLTAWLEAIAAECELVAAVEAWDEPLALETVYVGGGTPSLLGAGVMAELRTRLERWARWDATPLEWTVEANPESVDGVLARDWHTAGVNRVSLGVQSFHEPALRWMGRLHGPDGAARAMDAARAAGIGNVSIDLIFGLPDRLGRDWATDLERALALEPDHISLYGLTAEPGAALGRWVNEGREALPHEDVYAREYLLAAQMLRAAGFRHYEVSNFAQPGRESRHNSAYWTGAAYLGLGPSAHSYASPMRRWNVRDWDAYRERVARRERPIADEEQITGDAARLEAVWLALRTAAGLPAADWSRAQERVVHGWVQTGRAERTASGVRLTPRGWLLLDRLAVDFDAAAERWPPGAEKTDARLSAGAGRRPAGSAAPL